MIHEIKNAMFLCDYASEYSGNFVSSLLSLELMLSEYDIKCVYVFPLESMGREWIKKLTDSGREIVFFNFRLGRVKIIRDLCKLIDKYSIDLLHSHFTFVLGIEILSILRPDVKWVIHVHSDFTAGTKNIKLKIVNWLLYEVLSFNSTFLFVSPHFVNTNTSQLIYLPNALADDRLLCEHQSGNLLRQELGISNDTTVIEVFGWSPYVKGVDIATEAVGKLIKSGYDVKLLLVCGRTIRKSEMIDYIEKNTNYTGKEDFIYYMEPIEDVFRYHEAADICLSASRSEGFSYSVLEMLSIGKRCVCSDIAGLNWSFKYQMVVKFKSNSVESCYEAIKTAIEELPFYSDCVADAVKKEYSIEKWTREIIRIYGLERIGNSDNDTESLVCDE